MTDIQELPKLYRELADWWPILSSPKDYAEEANFYQQVIFSESVRSPKTLLELGCGGGNNASHLKQHFHMTLVDLSPGMLQVSQRLNPECEHILGDMRDLRLKRQFDAVFIHDAIVYMSTEGELSKAIETAYVHCKPGGIALFAPDCTKETFKPSTEHGGHDAQDRGMRYLEWTWDPDPGDTQYVSFMVYLLREANDDQVRCVLDKHVCGLFEHAQWMKLIKEAGFEPQSIPFEHSELEPGSTYVFIGRKN